MDLLSSKGNELKSFSLTNNYKNYITKYTRIATKYYEKKKMHKTSKTLIDVLLHNSNCVVSTNVFGCPFSDHNFILANLDFKPTRKITIEPIFTRCLTQKKLEEIDEELSKLNHSFLDNNDVNNNWLELKNN